jgi:hypothetical protein
LWWCFNANLVFCFGQNLFIIKEESSGAVSNTTFPNWALSSSFKEATWLAMIPLILTLYILPNDSTDFTEDHPGVQPGHLPPWQHDGAGGVSANGSVV